MISDNNFISQNREVKEEIGQNCNTSVKSKERKVKKR